MNQLRNKPACTGRFATAVDHTWALKAFKAALSLCLALCLCIPLPAFATTADDLASAKERYAEVERQLDAIANEFQALSIQQSDTLDQIESVHKQIDETQAEITQREAELARHQEQLNAFIVSTYKQGPMQYLDVLLDATSFKDFITKMEYVSRISEQKEKLIETVLQIRAELDERKAQLEKDMASLEELRAQQAEQMAAMQEDQAEVAALLESLDDEVRELTEKNNAEILARAREASQNSYSGGWSTPAELVVTGEGSASAVIAACYTTPSPGLNWCAAWVTNVVRNAGVGTFWGNACDMYNMYCYSSDLSELQPGMIIAVSTNSRGGWAGMVYGHVGIYIGNGVVMENIGSIVQTPLSEWIDWYSASVTPRWGWLGGVVLT